MNQALVIGVSSALAAPLSAGITLTEKTVGRHFSVTSAHDPGALEFGAFAGIDTCVFLMARQCKLNPVLITHDVSAGNVNMTKPEHTLGSLLEMAEGVGYAHHVKRLGARKIQYNALKF